MDAIALLKSQHREVEELFAQFEKARQPSKKEALVRTICDKLAVHASLEEQHFYPAVKTKKTEDLLLESLEEHLAAKRLIADLLDMSPSDESFEAKVKVLEEEIKHHVKEEERELFPKVKRILSPSDLKELATMMTSTKEELEANAAPREAVRRETAHAPSLP